MGAGLILVILLALAIFVFVGIYNSLVSKRVAVEGAWAQIDVQLKRRHDLIPNLVETVKGYAGHERETLERVIKARNSAVSASSSHDIKSQIQAENMLSGALRQLFALSESYPDLKANQNFLHLQEEITSTENTVGFARQNYNDNVTIYNTSIQQIPGNLVAGLANFAPKEFYEIEERQAVAEPPRVSF